VRWRGSTEVHDTASSATACYQLHVTGAASTAAAHAQPLTWPHRHQQELLKWLCRKANMLQCTCLLACPDPQREAQASAQISELQGQRHSLAQAKAETERRLTECEAALRQERERAAGTRTTAELRLMVQSLQAEVALKGRQAAAAAVGGWGGCRPGVGSKRERERQCCSWLGTRHASEFCCGRRQAAGGYICPCI
jgi:hypothetical protein